MGEIVLSVDIARAPGDVFGYVTDPRRFAEWQADVVGVGVPDEEPLGVGSRFSTTRRIGRGERTMTQEVVEASAPRRWAVRGVGGPIRPDVSLTVEPSGDGTRATFTFDFRGHAFGRLLLPLVRRMTAKAAPISLERLKRRLETP